MYYYFFSLKKSNNSKFPSLLKNAGFERIFPFHSPPPHQAWPEDGWPLSSGGRIRKTRNRTRLPIPWLYRRSNRCTARLYQKTELDLYRIYFFWPNERRQLEKCLQRKKRNVETPFADGCEKTKQLYNNYYTRSL